MNFLKYLGVAMQIAGILAEADVEFEAGAPVTIPPILTYIDGKHVSIAITVTPQ